MEPITVLLLILVATVVLLLVYILTEKRKKTDIEQKMLHAMFSHDKVNIKDELLTHNEQRFFHDLQKKFGDKYHIYPLLGLTALIRTREDESDLHKKHDNINKFYFDFVLCSRQHLKPVCVIELNDRAHSRLTRKQRDSYFASVLSAAGLKYFSYEPNFLTYDHYMEEIDKILHT